MTFQAGTISIAAAFLFCGTSSTSVAATTDQGGLLELAVDRGHDSGLLIATGAVRGGGEARQGGGNRGGGGAESRQVRSSASSNVNHNRNTNANVNRNINANRNVDANVNRNVNVDRDVNVNRNVNVDVDRNYYGGWDDHYHPLATAAAITATAAVVGSIVRTIPPSCSTVIVNGISYSQCGSTWYQPQYAGTTVQYVVVSPPQ